MNISVIDKSNYLRGLLILAKKDIHISQFEKKIIYNAGIQLGFSSSFCEEILKTLLHNESLCDDPVKFINSKVAKSFISDGLILSSAGRQISPAQIIWLKKSADINGINSVWFKEELLKCKRKTNYPASTQLTLYSII